VLLGSMLGLAVAAATGDVSDQVAMATKLVELLGLVALWSPDPGLRRDRRRAARREEMLHVWTVPGAPEAFGDLPEEWLAEHPGS
jgi:hypothetical protein